jgi:hypothetical protein
MTNHFDDDVVEEDDNYYDYDLFENPEKSYNDGFAYEEDAYDDGDFED